jgi:hypothetical protein
MGYMFPLPFVKMSAVGIPRYIFCFCLYSVQLILFIFKFSGFLWSSSIEGQKRMVLNEKEALQTSKLNKFYFLTFYDEQIKMQNSFYLLVCTYVLGMYVY